MNTQLLAQSNAQEAGFLAIERANLSGATKMQYSKALRNYLSSGHKLGDPGELAEYAADLKPSSRAFLKAAVRLMTAEYMLALKAGATPENVAATQAGLYRLEALNSAVKVQPVKGVKAHSWLSQSQVKALVDGCDHNTLEGRRNWIILALLVGAGLRRDEVVNLDCADVVDLPGRTVLQVTGKGDKLRVIPIKASFAERLRAWCAEIGGGKVARSVGRWGTLGDSLSAIGVFQIVRKHGAKIGKPGLDPHDLRRTYAQLGYEAGVGIVQISGLLGHADVSTTQRYLNLDLNLETTISDFIPLD
jgi:site-specific recombinase XerC